MALEEKKRSIFSGPIEVTTRGAGPYNIINCDNCSTFVRQLSQTDAEIIHTNNLIVICSQCWVKLQEDKKNLKNLK